MRASASTFPFSSAAVCRDVATQLAQDSLDLVALLDLELSPAVVDLDRDHRLDEDGRSARRLVVDDTVELPPRLGLDRDDVAALADRHEVVLQYRPVRGRRDDVVQPVEQPLVGDPELDPNATEVGRRRVEDGVVLADAAAMSPSSAGRSTINCAMSASPGTSA